MVDGGAFRGARLYRFLRGSVGDDLLTTAIPYDELTMKSRVQKVILVLGRIMLPEVTRATENKM